MAELVPLGVVTTTLTVAALLAEGAVQVIWVGLTTMMLVAAEPPKVTPVAPMKFVPAMVTLEVLPSGPLGGVTPVTVGAVW